MPNPLTLRLLACILVIAVIGWQVKKHRDQAHLEPVRAKVGR